jgi:hypothetical protein
MSLENYDSQREYDKFRVKGVNSNSSVDDVTVAVQLEDSDGPISGTNPLPVINGIGDLAIDVWGTPKVTTVKSLVHGMFTFDVPSTIWRIYENDVEVQNDASTGAVSTDGALVIDTAQGTLDSVFVRSRRHPRYQPNRGHIWSSALILPNSTNDGIRDFGFITANNSVCFRLKSDGNLYAVIVSGGVQTKEELITIPASFTGFDVEKGNIYDIRFQWRGVGNYYWYIGNPATGLIELVHTINNLGTLTTLSVENPALSAGFKATKTTEDVVIKAGCVDVSSEGGGEPREQYGQATAENTVTADTTTGGVVALRNPLLAPSGEENTRDLRLARITITASKKSTVEAYKTRDLTAITGGAWATVRSGDFVEINSTFTAIDKTKMESFAKFRPAAAATVVKDNPSSGSIEFYGVDGDYIVIVCTTGSAVDIEAEIEWGIEI